MQQTEECLAMTVLQISPMMSRKAQCIQFQHDCTCQIEPHFCIDHSAPELKVFLFFQRKDPAEMIF